MAKSPPSNYSSVTSHLLEELRSGGYPTIYEVEQRESSILEAYAKLEQLRNPTERQNLYHLIKLQKCSLAPVRRLPTEILLNIFKMIELFENDITRSFTHGLPFPFVLGQVSHCFRKVSKDASLWTTVVLLLDHDNARTMGSRRIINRARLLDLQMQYSQNLPLKIKVTTHPKCEHPSRVTSGILSFLDVLSAHSYRWKHLEMNDDLIDLIPAPSRLPELERFTTHKLDGAFVSPWLLNAQKLWRVDIPEIDSLIDYRLPWLQLRHITLKVGSGPLLREIAEFCPEVAELIFRDTESSVSSSSPEASLSKLSYARLQTSEAEDSSISNCLGFAACPSLRSLELVHTDYSGADTPELGNLLTSFLSRSQCALHTLSLNLVYISVGELLCSLECIPDLQTLELWEPRTLDVSVMVTEKFITAISKRQTSEDSNGRDAKTFALIPKLQSLTIESGFPFNDEYLLELIEGRFGQTEGLRVVTLTFKLRRMRSDLLNRLLAYRDRGMVVNVSSSLD